MEQNEMDKHNATVEMAAPDKKRVLIEVLEERMRQDKKWGVQNRNPFEYCAILGEEVGECNKAALEMFDMKFKKFNRKPDEFWLQELRMELIQVAAVAVAFVECIDRNEWEG